MALSHWPSIFNRGNPSLSEEHASDVREYPAINQQNQCMLGYRCEYQSKMTSPIQYLNNHQADTEGTSLSIA